MIGLRDFLQKFGVLLLMFAATQLMAWVPTAGHNMTVEPECRSSHLTRKILRNFSAERRGPISSQESLRVWTELESFVQEYFDDCGEQLQRSSLSNVLNYWEMTRVTYDLSQHPHRHELDFIFPRDEISIKTHLFLQPVDEPRPLVIFKCGLSCNFGDPSLRYTIMTFYDMGPFHVLFVPSHTGRDFIRDNRIFAIGGLDEGRILLKIAQHMRHENFEFAEQISQMHLFGMSLGGHAALYAALYADHHPELASTRNPFFKSVAVGCPVVDFKTSLKHITSEAWIARVLRRTQLKEITQLMSFVPFFGRFFDPHDSSFNPSQAELQRMMKDGVWNHYKKKTAENSWRMPPLEGLRFTQPDELWQWMNFAEQPLNYLRSPVFSWSPRNDDVVLFKDNAQALYRRDQELDQRRIFGLDTPYGSHCAFSSIYGWQASSSVWNGLFMARSPELIDSVRIEVQDFPHRRVGYRFRANNRKWRLDSTWLAVVDRPVLRLRSQFREVPCRMTSRSPQRCMSVEEIEIHYDDIGLDLNQIPRSDVEAQILTRRLNARLQILGPRGELMSKTENPHSLRWIRFGSE